jgi:hypothetical protein
VSAKEAGTLWLVLVYQFPKGPDSRRVRVWRRLQAIGAVAIKHSVYVLPFNDQSQEDFAWLLTELQAGGGDGVILESRFIDGMSDQQARDLFNTARNNDYKGLTDDIEQVLAGLPAEFEVDDEDSRQNARRTLQRVRKQIAEIEAIDFFGADGHDAVEAAMRALNERTEDRSVSEIAKEQSMGAVALEDAKNRVWVTRRGVQVDRIASAWLIKRWIDPDARFKFVAGKGYSRDEGELRFDMFEAEFTHEGDLCTFEVLARLARPDDAALQVVGEIVHDIDLKDGKFARPETEGIANLLSGIVAGIEDDEPRIKRGSQLFDDLYRFFSEVKA